MAVQILALEAIPQSSFDTTARPKEKIVNANRELDKLDYKFKSNGGF